MAYRTSGRKRGVWARGVDAVARILRWSVGVGLTIRDFAPEGDVDEAKRRRRREIQQLNNESVWLQKALFALRKAEDAREKLADVRSEEAGAYTLRVGDGSLPVEVLEDALEERAKRLIGQVRSMRRELR